jgi:hypothetical protein
MEILTTKELVKKMDDLNKEKFKYVGVWHIRSGCREEVQDHKNFINNLEAKPIIEIKIRKPKTPLEEEIEKYSLVIEISPPYVNIYNVDDVKDKLEGISIHKCLVKLQ